MISNVAFDPALMRYNPQYENALHHSASFQGYATNLANRLVNDHQILNGLVVDIGCGDGHFLDLMCRIGGNQGKGFDPSFHGGTLSEGVEIHRGYFEPGGLTVPADLIACRHVLEHIHQPQPWLQEIRNACAESDPVVFFEVPDARWTLMNGGVWDILYEHCSYFTPLSLATLFERSGFEVLKTCSEYHGQFLQIEAKPSHSAKPASKGDEETVETAAQAASDFSRVYEERRLEWNRWLSQLEDDRRVAVWGAGTKGAMFLSSLEERDRVSCVVDINPKKHGRYVAGTGHCIVEPGFLRDVTPDVVFVMNPVYEHEIRSHLNSLGIQAAITCL